MSMFWPPQVILFSTDLPRALLIAWNADPDGNPVQLVQHLATPPE